MTLEAYLQRPDQSLGRLAKAIGVSPITVYRYAQGKSIPRPRTMRRILAATNGAVRPEDFYDLTPEPKQ